MLEKGTALGSLQVCFKTRLKSKLQMFGAGSGGRRLLEIFLSFFLLVWLVYFLSFNALANETVPAVEVWSSAFSWFSGKQKAEIEEGLRSGIWIVPWQG